MSKHDERDRADAADALIAERRKSLDGPTLDLLRDDDEALAEAAAIQRDIDINGPTTGEYDPDLDERYGNRGNAHA